MVPDTLVGVSLSPETLAPSQYRISTEFQLYISGLVLGSSEVYPLFREDVGLSFAVDPSEPWLRPTQLFRS